MQIGVGLITYPVMNLSTNHLLPSIFLLLLLLLLFLGWGVTLKWTVNMEWAQHI